MVWEKEEPVLVLPKSRVAKGILHRVFIFKTIYEERKRYEKNKGVYLSTKNKGK
jgi:hypothetical protein